jgi:O-antigen/teichoic acid export membrane protein
MLIGVIMNPYYVSKLGAEAYGLIAFFSILTVWMNLLDLGMTPTLGREVAVARTKYNGISDLRKLLRSFEIIFITISIFVFSIFFYFQNWLSTKWINAIILSTEEISKSIVLMGALIGLRWLSSLYRSVIIGFEFHVSLNIINIFFSTFKFVGVIALFAFLNTNIYTFFIYQLILGLIEAFFLMFFVYKLMPEKNIKLPIVSFYWVKIKNIIPFSLSMAYSSVVWIFVSQVDKLTLSGILSLKEFGYFNLVVVIASTMNVLSNPISQAVLPRMAYLFSKKNLDSMLDLYKSTTQLITLISVSVTIIVALYPEQIIYAWTGNKEAAIWSKNVLFWYALGSGVLSILSFQHYLQVAIGQLKLQVIGGTITLLIDVPVIIFVSMNFGAENTGMVWFFLRILWFLIWTPFIHNKYFPGLHLKWLLNDVLKITLSIIISAILLRILFPLKMTTRLNIFSHLILIGIVVFFVGSLSSNFIRKKAIYYLKFNFT